MKLRKSRRSYSNLNFNRRDGSEFSFIVICRIPTNNFLIKNEKNPEEIVTLLKEMKICEKNVIKADSSGFSLLSLLLPIEISKDMDIQKLMLYRKVQSNAVKEIFRKYL